MAWKPRFPRTLTVAVILTALMAPPSLASADAAGPCGDGQVISLPNGAIGCTHGPDEIPVGASPSSSRMLQPTSIPTVTCLDDGTSGNRVQALYVVAAGRPDRSAEVIPQIRHWVADVDAIFSGSSVGYGVDMTVRWVHDSDCVVDVKTVVVPAGAIDSFSDTIDALDVAGYNKPGRHYLTWVDSSEYCGIAATFNDDSFGPENAHNGAWSLYARVDRDCWGYDGLVEAHELTHMLGAVQASAPNATGNGHCTDEYDIMCYEDSDSVEMVYSCPDAAGELLLDCNDDDYFNPNPAPGSYLAEHWNVARSSFLHNGDPAARTTDPLAPSSGNMFDDVGPTHAFRADIEWLAGEGITQGCNPPANTEFCPDDEVTRGQMAAFLVRALGLPDGGASPFDHDNNSVFETDIARLAAASITSGCGPATFCPEAPVTRGQMAAFLVRALGYTDSGPGDLFTDDNGSVFESDIDRLATAGVTLGCNPPANTEFCPDQPVTRAQMAAFLNRAQP